MRRVHPFAGAIACLALALGPGLARADMAADPLRLVSDKADLVLKIEQPRRLVQGIMALDAFKQLQNLDAVHELYESTNSRRFFQLVGYFEKKFNADRIELLDRLAGGGLVVAVKFKPEPTVMVVVQAKSAALLQRYVDVAAEIADQELARLEGKDKLTRGKHHGVPTFNVGKTFAMAVVGSALVLSNSAKAVEQAIDLHGKGPTGSMARSPALVEMHKLLPPDPAAWLWLNLAQAHDDPGLKGIFDQTKDNGIVPVFFGGLFNVAARAPYLCLGVYQKANEFDLTLRFPRGRKGMAEAVALHLPEDGKVSLPLLEPAHTILTASYYLDLAKLWERRNKLLKPEELKGLNDLDQKSALFLGGVKLGKLLGQTGSHQRLVVAHQAKPGYKIVPSVRFPAAAVVLEMRNPAFARTAETMARAAGLLGAFKFSLRLVEEKHGGHKIVGYRFPENGKVPGDETNLRFNVSPCLVTVGNQFVLSSTLELARDLVDALDRESAMPAYSLCNRAKAYSIGLADGMRNTEKQLLTQVILAQALAPADAREQVRRLIGMVEQLGSVQLETHYGDNSFQVNVHVKLGR